MSVSTETYVRGLSRTRQFSSVPTFWLLDCRINRCVERMDTCGEHTYFNVPLSFSFIYNAVSFVVSRMFPSPPFLRPWSFLSKKPEGRSRGMTEVARLRDTKNFDQRLRLLPRSRRFNEEILLFNGGVKMKYRKRIFQELQLYGIPRVSSHGRFTGEKFNDEIFSQLYQPIYTLIGRVSSKSRNQTDLEESRSFAFPLVTRLVLSTSLQTIRRAPGDVSNLRLVRVQPEPQTQRRFHLRRDTMSLNNAYQVTFGILAPVVLPTFLPLQRTSKKKKSLKLKEKREGAVGEFWGKRSGSGWCFARQSGKKRWRGLVHHVTRGLRWQGRGERPRNGENRGARKWLCTRVHSALAV